MTTLEERLRATLRRDGPMFVATYMQTCLTDPDHGYYTRSQAIGRQGDFITAPEISQVFGELIGLFFADYWQRSGAPSAVTLIELGPGRGTLMADLLRAAKTVPGFAKSLDVHLVEISPLLRDEQAERLAGCGFQPTWHADIADIADIATGQPVFVIANEFFDALPIRQFVLGENGWRERVICEEPVTGALVMGLSEQLATVPDRFCLSPVGSTVETTEAAGGIGRHIAGRIATHGGIGLVIDYGHGGSAVGDTFQAVRDHAYADPLVEPGKADLTAHVDFGYLADCAVEAGAKPWRLIDQRAFLQNLGLGERVQGLSRGKPPSLVRDLKAAADRLIGESQMGALFKCLAITPAGAPSICPAGFEQPVFEQRNNPR